MMDRDKALEAVRANVCNENLIKHMLATEAIMKALARRLGEDEETWGLVGLLHDIDVELTADDFSRHSRVGAEMVRGLGAPDEMCRAILCHNEVHGVPCDTTMGTALFCTDPLTGLITAAALVRPDKSLSGVTVETLHKRFKEKRFAAGARRDVIEACGGIGLQLEEFLELGLKAMQESSADLGL